MRWLSLLLAAVCLAVPAAAQDDTVKDFKRFFRKEKDPTVRVELILSLGGIDDPGVASVLLPVLEDEDPAQAAAALRVISGLKEPAAAARTRASARRRPRARDWAARRRACLPRAPGAAARGWRVP